jgi:hypothetical protein
MYVCGLAESVIGWHPRLLLTSGGGGVDRGGAASPAGRDAGGGRDEDGFEGGEGKGAG